MNRIRIQQTHILLAGILCAGAIALPAQGASFDCAKASTKVEHMICDNSELSRLDDELAARYVAAAQRKMEANGLREAQKRWLAERDACLDADCLVKAYHRRLAELSVALTYSRVAADRPKFSEDGAPHSGNTHYPPYPAYWDLETPIATSQRTVGLRVLPLENGDDLIGFLPPEKRETRIFQAIPNKELRWISFFTRQRAVVDDGQAIFSDGVALRLIEKALQRTNYPGTAELTDGSYVISSQGVLFRGCYQGPAGNKIAHYKTKNTMALLGVPRVVFLVLENPVTILTGSPKRPNSSPACDAAEQHIISRVVSVNGDLAPLGDGGFLLMDAPHGLVIRFDANMNTQSDLLNKKIFVFDAELTDAIFIDKKTHKDYINEKDGIRMQEVVNDLYEYLLGISKGKK